MESDCLIEATQGDSDTTCGGTASNTGNQLKISLKTKKIEFVE
jgi:hypothetical protein